MLWLYVYCLMSCQLLLHAEQPVVKSRPILLDHWIEFRRSSLFFCCWTQPLQSGPFPFPLALSFFFFTHPPIPHSLYFIHPGWRQPLLPRPVQLSPLRSFHSCSHSAHISHPWRDAAHFTHSALPICSVNQNREETLELMGRFLMLLRLGSVEKCGN